MKITKAIELAMKDGKGISRSSKQPMATTIIPTNTISCCLVVPFKGSIAVKRWEPTAEDLLATDWEVWG